jgi:ADP-heptose:LPS heptosyltransferase
MAAGITKYLSEIDDMIVFDLPWVKAKEVIASDEIFGLVELLKKKSFDAVVIFTVFSQNPLPAAMIAYMAGIPLRLAYCRENPYELLTDWVPDKEPYTFIQHQVKRDIALVKSVGAFTDNCNLHLTTSPASGTAVTIKLKEAGVDLSKKWLIFHAGVSEKKREYPEQLWVDAAIKIIREKQFQVIFTGAGSEQSVCNLLAEQTGKGAFSVAGLFNLEEFISLIKLAPIIVSVNTGAVHIAAALGTPIIVLYAQTNPQHTPWMVPNKVLEFAVKADSRSKNEIIQYLYKEVYNTPVEMPQPDTIFNAVTGLLNKELI